MNEGCETVELNLLDEKGINYCIKVSPEDATPANNGK